MRHSIRVALLVSGVSLVAACASGDDVDDRVELDTSLVGPDPSILEDDASQNTLVSDSMSSNTMFSDTLVVDTMVDVTLVDTTDLSGPPKNPTDGTTVGGPTPP